MRNLKAILMGSAAMACIGFAPGTAHAQSYAFGDGSTFAQFAYRELADCLYNQLQGSTGKPGPLAKAPHCAAFDGSGFGGGIFYAPTGSGNGKATMLSNSITTIGTPSNSVPYTDSTVTFTNPSGIQNPNTDYDGVQFAGSDDIINSTDIANWTSANNFTKFGNYYELPAFIGAVGIGFNGTDGTGAALNILPATPTGGSSGLNLSRNAICGIVSGHITKWNNAILTALNGGVLGTGQITFIHRQDGSGTTFLLSNALATQCQFEIGPNNESDSTTVSYAYPWTDHASACPRPIAHGANQSNWPDQFPTDQCGNANPTPTGASYANASGSGSLVALVGSTHGSMGYSSDDFWLPIRTGGLPAANLQSQWDITAGTGTFEPPTAAGAQIAMSSSVPQFTDAGVATDTILNPLAWSLQGVVPNPSVPGSYAISGFTWLEMYQCYAAHANGNNPFVWFATFLDYLYGSSNAGAILGDNGFAQVQGPWAVAVTNLFSHPTGGPAQHGNVGCTTIAGAY